LPAEIPALLCAGVSGDVPAGMARSHARPFDSTAGRGAGAGRRRPGAGLPSRPRTCERTYRVFALLVAEKRRAARTGALRRKSSVAWAERFRRSGDSFIGRRFHAHSWFPQSRLSARRTRAALGQRELGARTCRAAFFSATALASALVIDPARWHQALERPEALARFERDEQNRPTGCGRPNRRPSSVALERRGPRSDLPWQQRGSRLAHRVAQVEDLSPRTFC